MPGGVIQLLKLGEEDKYLIGTPQITFFKTVFKRHSNFALETRQYQFNNATSFGSHASFKIPHDGDLISRITLNVKLPNLNPNGTTDNTFGYVNSIGHLLIEETWIEIGGTTIDKQYGEWLEIWTEIAQNNAKIDGYNEMIGRKRRTTFRYNTFSNNVELFIPMNFWFCKNYGLALPLVALKFQNVFFHVKFRKFDHCWISKNPNLKPFDQLRLMVDIYIDYIFLDEAERQKFITNDQTYLIEQVQSMGDKYYETGTPFVNMQLDLYHPCKELIWVIQRADVYNRSSSESDSDFTYGNDWFNYSTVKTNFTHNIKDTFVSAKLQLDGKDRTSFINASVLRVLNNYYHHSRIPNNYIYSLPFALRPEEHQPTGSLNFSVIDKKILQLKMNDGIDYDFVVKLFSINYNILIFTGGMSGLVFNI